VRRNVDSPEKTSVVVAGRLILLLLAGVATVWAFAFSGARDYPPSGASEHAHAHPGGGEHDHAGGSGPAANPVFTVPSADARVIGIAETRTFSLSVRAAAWLDSNGQVIALLRNDELSGLSPGEHAFFFRAAAPAEGIGVRLIAEPPAPWDGSTSRVRFRLDARASGLEPGGVGWVELAARPRVLLIIPASAVLYSPEGPYVLAAADGRSFSTRHVQIGTVYRGLAVVLSGLREGEPIVVGGTFSWDAERRLRVQREAMAGAMH